MAMTFGLVAVISPTVGMAVTWLVTHRALSAMETYGVKDPEFKSMPIGEVLVPALTGLALALGALPLCIMFIVRALRERRKLNAATRDSH